MLSFDRSAMRPWDLSGRAIADKNLGPTSEEIVIIVGSSSGYVLAETRETDRRGCKKAE